MKDVKNEEELSILIKKMRAILQAEYENYKAKRLEIGERHFSNIIFSNVAFSNKIAAQFSKVLGYTTEDWIFYKDHLKEKNKLIIKKRHKK